MEPNSTIGRESLLLAADTYYLQGNNANYIQAEAKYRDFLNRFPTSEQSAYVQFQIANSLAKRMERPDRDQAVTRKALEAYQDLIRLYPTSEYAAAVDRAVEGGAGQPRRARVHGRPLLPAVRHPAGRRASASSTCSAPTRSTRSATR